MTTLAEDQKFDEPLSMPRLLAVDASLADDQAGIAYEGLANSCPACLNDQNVSVARCVHTIAISLSLTVGMIS